MTPIERECRSISTRIGCALLIFAALVLLQSAVLAIFPLFTASLSALWAEIVYELVSALLYTLVFTLPVLFFKWVSRTQRTAPMRLAPELTVDGLLCAFFGVAVTLALAFVNAKIVGVFQYADFSDQYLWQSDVSANYQLVLLFLTLAVVPAFVEELLFRGLILENLLPCGKEVAILGSAFLFGMMHQNAEQLLYATGAGIVFGWIYVRTRSIWPCVLAHFINNFQSVLQTAFLARLPLHRAQSVLYIVEAMLLALGVLSGIYLFRQKEQKQPKVCSAEVAQIPLRRKVRLFFSVPMTLFVLWCVSSMIVLIWMSFSM